MSRTFLVMASSGQGVVTVTFSEPVVEERVIATGFISNFDKNSVSREVYTIIRDLMVSGLVSKIDWHPKNGLTMTLARSKRRDWLVNRLEGILSPFAVKAREA